MTRGTVRKIINQYAPTLMGVKAGSLVKLNSSVCDFAIDLLASLGTMYVGTLVLRSDESNVFILVYNKEKLNKILKNNKTRKFLSKFGYEGNMESMLLHLSERMKLGVPHEIGIFLGYPLWDVVGFINHEGKEYKTLGCWKVYAKKDDAIKTFDMIKSSRKMCLDRYETTHNFLESVSFN